MFFVLIHVYSVGIQGKIFSLARKGFVSAVIQAGMWILQGHFPIFARRWHYCWECQLKPSRPLTNHEKRRVELDVESSASSTKGCESELAGCVKSPCFCGLFFLQMNSKRDETMPVNHFTTNVIGSLCGILGEYDYDELSQSINHQSSEYGLNQHYLTFWTASCARR